PMININNTVVDRIVFLFYVLFIAQFVKKTRKITFPPKITTNFELKKKLIVDRPTRFFLAMSLYRIKQFFRPYSSTAVLIEDPKVEIRYRDSRSKLLNVRYAVVNTAKKCTWKRQSPLKQRCILEMLQL